MAGVDRLTGKVIERPAHLKQSIEAVLTTPTEVRLMRLDFGNGALAKDGSTKPDLKDQEIVEFAREALVKWEPRAEFLKIQASRRHDGQIASYRIEYRYRITSIHRGA